MLGPNPQTGAQMGAPPTMPGPGTQTANTPALMPGQQAGQQLPATVPQPPAMVHDVTIKTKRKRCQARVEGVPPEEFGIARNARNIADCGYCFHEVVKREADLIADGFDAEQIKKLPNRGEKHTQEGIARDTVNESYAGSRTGDGMNSANRDVLVTEHYIRMDYEGNDKVSLYRVTTGGEQGEVLRRNGEDEIIQVEEIPFAAMTPVIVTHRFFGRSIADLVMDIQRIKTALLRGMLDNLYLHNNPRVEVAETFASENTLDDLLVSRPGGIVRTKQPGGINWQVVPDITGSVYPALQYFDSVREWRSGVTRQGQGVDPNALQNQVATIANQMADAAQAKTKLIARIFAETGIRDLFSLLHGVIRKNGQQAETARLRNKWVTVDPRDWKERNDMTINVGLGTGSKQAQLAQVMAIIGLQKEALAAGKTNLVSDANLYNAAREVTKLTGMKNVEEFFTDPATQPPPQPKQDPKMLEIQAKQQAEQAKTANDAAHQEKQFQRDTAHQQMKMQGDMQVQQAKTQAEIALEQQKFELDRELKLIDARIKEQQHQQTMQLNHAKHEMDMQTQQVKQAQTAKPKASIEVKHGADEITGPMSEAIGKLGEHVANSHAQTVQAVGAILESHRRPRTVKSSTGKTFTIE